MNMRVPNCKLFAKFGVDLEAADGQKIADAAKRIYAELPASYKARPLVMPIQDNVWRCRTLQPGGPILRKSRVFTLDVRRHFDRTERTYLLWGRQVIEFIGENGGGPGGAATEASTEQRLDRC
jgi:hypothetical protein